LAARHHLVGMLAPAPRTHLSDFRNVGPSATLAVDVQLMVRTGLSLIW